MCGTLYYDGRLSATTFVDFSLVELSQDFFEWLCYALWKTFSGARLAKLDKASQEGVTEPVVISLNKELTPLQLRLRYHLR